MDKCAVGVLGPSQCPGCGETGDSSSVLGVAQGEGTSTVIDPTACVQMAFTGRVTWWLSLQTGYSAPSGTLDLTEEGAASATVSVAAGSCCGHSDGAPEPFSTCPPLILSSVSSCWHT